MPASVTEEELLLGFGGVSEPSVQGATGTGQRGLLRRRCVAAAASGLALAAVALCAVSLRGVSHGGGHASAADESLAAIGLDANSTEGVVSINGGNGTDVNHTEDATSTNGSSGAHIGERAGTPKKDEQAGAAHRQGKAHREGHDKADADGHNNDKKAKFDPKKPWLTRRGSFFVIGDWGYDPIAHWKTINNGTCQKAIAKKMLDHMEALGDVRFVLNLGDSFYPDGVKSKDDPQWERKWRNVYDKKLRSVPWYSVYGNHDFQHDPGACSAHPTDGAQINGDIDNKDFFYMPDYSWFIDHPELDLEVIALEMNHFESGGQEAHFWDCRLTPCEKSCKEHANTRAVQSLRLFHNRLVDSKRKNFLVFSHYPTDHFSAAPHFMAGLRNSSNRHITYFGGHVHDVRQGDTTSIHPNVNWLSGGGGGWGCDGNNLGFVVGEISRDSKVSTYPELVDKQVCCGSKPKLEWKGGDSCSWLSSDNCINTDHIACSCRQKNPDGPCTPCPNSHKREP
mmetsp:Transcript_96781/g.244020  ORF Transcript_96781/g.244020 Transcript_96781/m.244020 type:complete len:509 (-) Transcript_96781:126-1652(-)